VGAGAVACKRTAILLHCDMVNPSAISWLWRGFKGNSVTFALLFSCLVLGWSVTGSIWFFLRSAGIHWLFALVLPALFFGWLAKQESRVIPDEAKRRLYARSLIVGSLVIAVVIAWIRH
jgi:hypothetical protein